MAMFDYDDDKVIDVERFSEKFFDHSTYRLQFDFGAKGTLARFRPG